MKPSGSNKLIFQALVLSACLFAPGYLGGQKAYQAPPLGSVQQPVSPDSEEFKQIQIQEYLGKQVDTNISFTDENGREISLSSLFDGTRPVLLNLVYFECPSLCGMLMNGVMEAIRRIRLDVGKDYHYVALSIDHREDPELAAMKKENYLKDYGRIGTDAGFTFLTGSKENIQKLADQVGFGFRYDEDTREYHHAAGFFVLTPTAEISRVHYGVQFDPKDVHLSLLEAAGGKIGGIADKVLMFCFRYDPNSKGYALQAFRLVQAGGALTLAVLGFYLFLFWRRQKIKGEAQSRKTA